MNNQLIPLTLEEILSNWRPGNNNWDWESEKHDILVRDADRTENVRKAIKQGGGFGFADDRAPIKLGSDGRVHNGHHRLVIAMEMEVPPPFFMVQLSDVTPPPKTSNGARKRRTRVHR